MSTPTRCWTRSTSLRPQIQGKVVEAFAAGGPEAATELANDYITQVANELGISEMEAAELLGMTDVQALIHVAIEQASLANAQSQLDLLTGFGGDTPLTASIQLALDTGKITPEQAQALVQDQFGGPDGLGVEIPGELKVKTTKQELAEAYKLVGIDPDEPIGQPLKVLPTGLTAAGRSSRPAPVARAGRHPGADKTGAHQFCLSGWADPDGCRRPGRSGGGAMSMAAAGATPTATGPAPMSCPSRPSRPQMPVVINNVSTVIAADVGAPWDVVRPSTTRPQQRPADAEGPVMPVPTFEFTEPGGADRADGPVPTAVPRPGPLGAGRLGGRRSGGVAPGTLYEPQWAEVTCDVHEVTTDNGRARRPTGSPRRRRRSSPPTCRVGRRRSAGHLAAVLRRLRTHRPGVGFVVGTLVGHGGSAARDDRLVITWTTSAPGPRWCVPERTGPAKLPANRAACSCGTPTRREGSSATITIGPFPAAVAGDMVWLSAVHGGSRPRTITFSAW